MADDANDPEEQKPNTNFAAARFLFFLILIGIGLAVFAGMKSAQNRRLGLAPNPPDDSSWGLWPWMLGVAVVTAVLLWARRNAKKANALFVQSDDALALLDGGDLPAALDLHVELRQQHKKQHVFNHGLLLNEGICLERIGRLDAAISAFREAASQQFLEAEEVTLRPIVHAHLALCEAIKGDLDAAEKHQANAHAKLTLRLSALIMLVDTLIGLRQGRQAAVLKDLSAHWTETEGRLNVHLAKVLRLLSAFGHSQLPDAPAHAAHIEQMLAGVRPFRPGEFDYLVGNWPEFRAFLERNGFVGAVQPETTN